MGINDCPSPVEKVLNVVEVVGSVVIVVDIVVVVVVVVVVDIVGIVIDVDVVVVVDIVVVDVNAVLEGSFQRGMMMYLLTITRYHVCVFLHSPPLVKWHRPTKLYQQTSFTPSMHTSTNPHTTHNT